MSVLTYYGGKARLAPWIEKFIPPHRTYVEPFAGGLAVLFRKAPSHLEVINDKDERIIRIYRVLQDDAKARELVGRLALTPYSRAEHRRARATLRDKEATEVALAWAAVIDIAQGINCKFSSGWRCSTENQGGVVQPMTFDGQLERILQAVERLRFVEIECRDALDVIRRYDARDTVVYCDPPYPGSDQGHYRGFTLEHFRELFDVLSGLMGSALLSCYSGTVTWDTPGWVCERKDVTISSNRHTMKGGERTEELWIKTGFRQRSLWDAETRINLELEKAGMA